MGPIDQFGHARIRDKSDKGCYENRKNSVSILEKFAVGSQLHGTAMIAVRESDEATIIATRD